MMAILNGEGCRINRKRMPWLICKMDRRWDLRWIEHPAGHQYDRTRYPDISTITDSCTCRMRTLQHWVHFNFEGWRLEVTDRKMQTAVISRGALRRVSCCLHGSAGEETLRND